MIAQTAIQDIYHRLKAKNTKYVDKKFKFNRTSEQGDKDEEKKSVNKIYGLKKGSDLEKKIIPKTFQLYFFRLVKTLHDKSNIGKLRDNTKLLNHFKVLPTTFFACGNAGTKNERIMVNHNGVKIKNTMRKVPMLERRKRVFYTEEQKYKELLSQVFMTNDEIENCRFEPNAGRINDHYNPKVGDDGEEYTYKNFMTRHGTNLERSHPEIFKRGILKRATREYNLGEFDKAYNTLMKGFNIESLKNKFDPQWYKK